MGITTNTLISIVLLEIAGHCAATSPSSIGVCSRRDRNINDCIKNVVNGMKAGLADGKVLEQYSVSSLEPFTIPSIVLKSGAAFEARYDDVMVNGASNFVIQSLTTSMKTLDFKFMLLFPYLTFHGTYNIKAKFFTTFFLGPDEVSGVLESTRANIRLQNELYEKNGKTYMRVKRVSATTHIGSGTFKLRNLFLGNQNATDTANEYINTHSRFFLKQISPSLSQSLADTVKNISNEILQKASYADFFPQE